MQTFSKHLYVAKTCTRPTEGLQMRRKYSVLGFKCRIFLVKEADKDFPKCDVFAF